MAVEEYDGWKVELNTYWRTTDVRIYDPSDAQIFNMNKVYDFFINLGWTPNAIAGMLGNMMVESTVNPWRFEHSSLNWDDVPAILTDEGGMGLTQWTPCRKYYNWAIDEGKDPKSGTTMCERIHYEQENGLQWNLDNILHYNWSQYVSSTETPETLSRVFLWAYERPGHLDPEQEAERLAQRAANARWCFDNIHGSGIRKAIMVLLSKNRRKELKKRCLRM